MGQGESWAPPQVAPPPVAAGAGTRVEGLDLARAIAMVGMLLMHTIGPSFPADGENRVLSGFVAFFHGRAAATFVVLAGVGLGLQASRADAVIVRRRTLLRVIPLFVGGVALAAVPDLRVLVIIHFYAAYFLVAVWALRWSSRRLVAVGLGLLVGWPLVASPWREVLLEGPAHLDLWLPHWMPYPSTLLFTGAYPVVPWVGFMLVGMALGRVRWDRRTAARVALAAGLGVIALQGSVGALRVIVHDTPAQGAFGVGIWYPDHSLNDAEYAEYYDGPPSDWLSRHRDADDLDDDAYRLHDHPAWGWGTVTTAGHRLSPLSDLAVLGFAVFTIAGCIAIGRRAFLEPLASLGRMALTFYVVHALALSRSYWIRFASADPDYAGQLARGATFVAAFSLFAWWWFRWFRRGPIESLLDRWSRIGERPGDQPV